MGEEREDPNRLTMCRLCLCENESFCNIFQADEWNGNVAAEVISDLLHFRVTETDGYPHVVCVHCLTKLTDFKVFREQCLTSKLTYDNVFALNPRVNIRQDETGEFITIKAEPIDFLEVEDDPVKEVQYEVNAEDQVVKETSVINNPEEPVIGTAVTKEGIYLEGGAQVEIRFCEVPREVSTEEVVIEDQQKLQESMDSCRSESDDLLDDSLDETSQSPDRSSGKRSKMRKRLGLERKLEIIRKLESGYSPAALGRAYNVNESTIRTIRKMGDKIKEALGHISSERLDSVRPQIVGDLIDDDPQMQSILMESTPELPRAPRRRKVITLGTKLEIIQKLEKGMSAAAAGRQYDMNESSVRTIWKMADKIKASVAHTGSLNAKITRTRSVLLEKMEKLLTKWVEMQTTLGVPTSSSVVRAKALVIYERLKKQQGSEQDEPFMASKGWYDKFCKRTKIQLPRLERVDDDKQ